MKTLTAVFFIAATAAVAQTNTNVSVTAWSPSPRTVTMADRLAYTRAIGMAASNAAQLVTVAPDRDVLRFAQSGTRSNGAWYVRTGTRRTASHNVLWDYGWWLRQLCWQGGCPTNQPLSVPFAVQTLRAWAAASKANMTVWQDIVVDTQTAIQLWQQMQDGGYDLNDKFPPPVIWKEEPVLTPLRK